MIKNSNIIIYTDGSSLGNPGPGGYGAVIYFEAENKVIEIGEQEEQKTTNNRMEIMAAIESLLAISEKTGQVVFYTDSEYLLNGITKWIFNWQKKNWKTAAKKPVLNQDLWQRLLLLVEDRQKRGEKIIWQRVPGHAGYLGNERADLIATSFAAGQDVTFAHGSCEEYEKMFGGQLIL